MTLTGTAKPARLESNGGTQSDPLPEILIGKDILELVSSAMYVDPLTVYREYVQNAADAVDIARSRGKLDAGETGRVDIAVIPETRSVRIRDNGSGLAFADFGRRLTALGGSSKRGTAARGFRGVGRLAGLAYAQELIFRSRVEGEKKVSQLRWDCRRLKAALRSAEPDTGVADLIREVVSLERIDAGDAPRRFFEVEMKGVVRLRNDRLMSPGAISEYLSQVAPVPFFPGFRFGPAIAEALHRFVDGVPLEIHVGGSDEAIYRPHRDRFHFDEKQSVTFNSLDVVEIPGIDGDVAAIAWVLHHDYHGAIPGSALVKGLRLRAGNVQIGDHALLEELFPEPRFNGWAVGEIHVLDRKIVPNGRRDHFEQNAHFHNLINHLAPTVRGIAQRCRTSSIQRKWVREFELQQRAAAETIGVIAQGGVSQAERKRLAASADQAIMHMTKIARMDLLSDADANRQQIIEDTREKLREAMDEANAVSSPLLRLPKHKQKAYEEFFALIYECSANRVAAKSLIDRILLRLDKLI
jgi:molecular chaperone HtpG